MITTIGVAGSCTVCHVNIDPKETVYDHDEQHHLMHEGCYQKMIEHCSITPEHLACPTCKKVIEIAIPITEFGYSRLGVYFGSATLVQIPATIMSLQESLNKSPEHPLEFLDQPHNIWQMASLIDEYLNKHIIPGNNPLRHYFNDNAGTPGKDWEVIGVVYWFRKLEWPAMYATKLAAARGRETLVNHLVLNRRRSLTALAFLEFVNGGYFNEARSILPSLDLSERERGAGVNNLVLADKREGATLLLEEGGISLSDRVSAVKSALFDQRYLMALKILSTINSSDD